jgi:hypothetical protein
VVVAPVAPLSITVAPEPLVAGLMVPEMLKVDNPVGGVMADCFVVRLWQPTIAVNIIKPTAQRKLFHRKPKDFTGGAFRAALS